MTGEEKCELGTELGVLTPKRKQGRPRKDHSLLLEGEKSSILQKEDAKVRKPRRKRNDGAWPGVADSAFLGQQVRGVLDGSFDAGYLLTVRVGDSQTVLRGVVFEPTLSVPISRTNDIAPNVKITRRGEYILPPIPQSTSTGSQMVISSPISRLPAPTLPSSVHNNVLGTPSTPHRESRPVQMAQVSSGQGSYVSTQSQGSSNKASPMLQECSHIISTPHKEEAEPPQQVDVQSGA